MNEGYLCVGNLCNCFFHSSNWEQRESRPDPDRRLFIVAYWYMRMPKRALGMILSNSMVLMGKSSASK